MRQLTFQDIDLRSHQSKVAESLEELAVLKKELDDLATKLDYDPPGLADEKFRRNCIADAILKINGWQREAEALNQPADYIAILIHAQDWLCRDLEEWESCVLRDL